jgi:EAL domain-containing protein (putative c-di-GMP-specific phosphodiesterase class I)
VAESVEKPEALRMLWEMGCKGFQGFLFATPLPPEDFIAFCERVETDGMRIKL